MSEHIMVANCRTFHYACEHVLETIRKQEAVVEAVRTLRDKRRRVSSSYKWLASDLDEACDALELLEKGARP